MDCSAIHKTCDTLRLSRQSKISLCSRLFACIRGSKKYLQWTLVRLACAITSPANRWIWCHRKQPLVAGIMEPLNNTNGRESLTCVLVPPDALVLIRPTCRLSVHTLEPVPLADLWLVTTDGSYSDRKPNGGWLLTSVLL